MVSALLNLQPLVGGRQVANVSHPLLFCAELKNVRSIVRPGKGAKTVWDEKADWHQASPKDCVYPGGVVDRHRDYRGVGDAADDRAEHRQEKIPPDFLHRQPPADRAGPEYVPR